jgi:sugar diacid utilization regulator
MDDVQDDGSTSTPPEGLDQVSVGDLIQTLGSHVLHLVCAPRGTDHALTGPLVAGLDDEGSASDRILLAAHVARSNAELLDMVREAARRDCPAVVVKAASIEPRIIREAGEELGVAVFITPEDMSWRHLDRLIAAACHTRLGSVRGFSVSPSSDLFSLANEIAYAVGGAVTIEDASDHVLAHSNLPHQEIDESRRRTILGRQVPGEAKKHNEAPQTDPQGAVVHVGPVWEGEFGRMAIAVRSGPEVLGTIWVVEHEPLGNEAEQALQQAASVTALHLIRSRSTADPHRRARVEALMTLLDGGDSTTAAAANLGLDGGLSYAVLALGPASGEVDPDMSTALLLEVAGVYCGAWHPSSVCAISGTTVYALVPVRETTGAREHLKRVARDVVRTVARTSSFSVCVGIGSIAAGQNEIHSSRRVADTVLRAISQEHAVDVATADDVRSRVVLAELRATAVSAFDLGVSPVQALLDHDRRRGTEHAKTLLAWLDAFGEARIAAATLFVHENTLRYRVRRISERFEIDLDDPQERLVTWLELRLRA